MITIAIPGRTTLALEHLVTDFNGTIAEEGRLLDGVDRRLVALAELLHVTVLTADTFGRARNELADLPVEIVVLSAGGEDAAKAAFVADRRSSSVVALGNGFNDRLMLKEAALGLAVLGTEGTAEAALEAADVIFRDARDALDSLLNPPRLVATLRR